MSVEKEVVCRAAKGDGKAFASLYEEYFERIYRYLYLRLGNQSDAEDLTQEVFVKALEAIRGYKWRGLPFASWLFRIAHNLMVDLLRKRGKVTEEASEDIAAGGETDPAATAERNIEVARLMDNLEKLSPAQKEVLSLRFGAGLSIAEVARLLDKSPGTVKALQYNGIVALRKRLTGEKNRKWQERWRIF